MGSGKSREVLKKLYIRSTDLMFTDLGADKEKEIYRVDDNYTVGHEKIFKEAYDLLDKKEGDYFDTLFEIADRYSVDIDARRSDYTKYGIKGSDYYSPKEEEFDSIIESIHAVSDLQKASGLKVEKLLHYTNNSNPSIELANAFVVATNRLGDDLKIYTQNGSRNIMLKTNIGSPLMRSNWSISTVLLTSAHGSATHEFGHLIMSEIADSHKDRLLKFAKEVKEYSAVTEYGNTNHNEAFAEAFTAYAYGINAFSGIGKRYYDSFKTLMKDVGYDKVFSSVAKPTLTPTKTETKKAVVNYSIKGKKFTHTKTPTSLKKGYFTKTIKGKKYVIDVNTGSILK